jgi:hypothetical protein
MELIITSEYTNMLNQIVDSIQIPVEGIEITSDIQAWCKERNIPENNALLTGKCLKNHQTGKHLILLRSEITESMQRSIIRAISIRGFNDKINLLETSWGFLEHLLFHELGHAKDNSWSETECDEWAFSMMEQVSN